MPPATTFETEFQMPDLVRELVGRRCRCGKVKRPRTTFCVSCYNSLPESLQNGLYRRIGNGYEQAYESAAKLIDAKK
jgi:uncharacterized OB-fold protein